MLAGPGSCPCAVDGNRARMRGLADVAACRCGSGAGVLGKPHKLNNYSSQVCVHPVQARLNACPQPARACIVLPRAAPRSAAARTPRTGYCGRRRRSDRPFRTGFIRWLVEGRVLSQAPVFHEFLESIYFFNLQSPSLDGEFDPGSGRTLAARLTHASRAVKAPSGVHKAANGRVTRGQPAPLPGIAGGNPG